MAYEKLMTDRCTLPERETISSINPTAMIELTNEQIKTLTPVILVTAFFNIAGWWLFPRYMILIIPASMVVLAGIGEYLKDTMK